jgi:mono/diheme cytochrome c family protein
VRQRSWIVIGVLAVSLPATRLNAQQPDGREIYRNECRSCHGANGVPSAQSRQLYPRIPTFADSAFLDGRSQDSIVAVLRRGVAPYMRSMRDKLSPAQMRAVAAFIRTLAHRRGTGSP